MPTKSFTATSMTASLSLPGFNSSCQFTKTSRYLRLSEFLRLHVPGAADRHRPRKSCCNLGIRSAQGNQVLHLALRPVVLQLHQHWGQKGPENVAHLLGRDNKHHKRAACVLNAEECSIEAAHLHDQAEDQRRELCESRVLRFRAFTPLSEFAGVRSQFRRLRDIATVYGSLLSLGLALQHPRVHCTASPESEQPPRCRGTCRQ